MIQTFSGFHHEHTEPPYWYRIEFHGKKKGGSRYVGVAFLCHNLLEELVPYAEHFRSHTYGADDVLCIRTRRVDSVDQTEGSFFDLRRKTLHWCCRYESIPEAQRFLDLIAEVRGKASPDPLPQPQAVVNVGEVSVAELCDILSKKNVLAFTGAGISVAGSFPDASTFSSYLGIHNDRPLDGYTKCVLEHPALLLQRLEKLYEAKPTKAHWVLKRLQDSLGFALWTGNFDGLHEATGAQVRFYGGTEEPNSNELRQHDVVLALGVSFDAFARFVRAYRKSRPDGKIIAIDLSVPLYLKQNDGLIRADLQEVLVQVENLLVDRSKTQRGGRASV